MKHLFSILLIFTILLNSTLVLSVEKKFSFRHSGILHTDEDFERMALMVENKVSPYIEGYEKLISSPYSQSSWKARNVSHVIRGGAGDNISLLYTDIAYAYQNALRWKIDKSTKHGDTARDILNAWSSTLKSIGGNADRYLASGLFGYQLANVSEIMRDYPGFDVEGMKEMLINVFYKPMNERFLISNEYGKDHNDAYITNYWANWDLCNMASCVAIGIFTDRKDIFDVGINYFKYGAGNGSIYNAILYLFDDELAQWQESGRDQGHSNLGIGLMASICEMAWNQGIDLYSYANNRFMYAAEYVAKYNNGEDVPFVTYEWGTGQKGELRSHHVISSAGRGEMRPIWEMIYNHYANRKGYSVPNIKKRAEIMRPEGGPGGHATTFDQIGFGTLLYTRPKSGADEAKIPKGDIKNGIYKIVSSLSDKAITFDNNNIVQMTKKDLDEQKWYVEHLGGGEYSIINFNNNKALEILDSSYENGAVLSLGEFKDSNNQRFTFIPKEDNTFRVIPSHSGKALDVEGASKNDGAKVVQYRYNLGKNQHFKLELIESLPDCDDIKIFVRGKRLYMDTPPKILNDRVLVPLRAIFEKLGVNITYESETRKITCIKDDVKIELTIDDSTAFLNGESLILDTPPIIINDRTMVPLRFVSESLGCTVIWHGDIKEIEVNY